MATSTTTSLNPTIKLRVHDIVSDSPEWLRRYKEKGWTVVPEAIPREKALAYAEKGYEWLESWDLGFDRNDPSTRKSENLPFSLRGGLYNRYGIGHEQFVWDLKSEPSLIEKWAQLYGTNELLCSFDGVNLSIPEKERPKTDSLFAPWAHVDQSAHSPEFECVQGILNLLPNGSEDGGLMVLDGSNKHYAEMWQRFDHLKPEGGWNKHAFQLVPEEMCTWLESKGCKWVKICAQPGDLLLWDSRTIHYGAPPSSTNDRFAAYVCYKPVSAVTDEAKEARVGAYASRSNTTHDPAIFRVPERLPPKEHRSYEIAIRRPIPNPKLSKKGRQLVGLDPY